MRDYWPRLLAPGREGLSESTFAGSALLHREDGATLVVVDHRHIEPGALLEELQVALAIGLHIRQADEEEPIGDLDREACQRRSARLLVLLHQHTRHIGDTTTIEIRRQRECQFGGVARRK